MGTRPVASRNSRRGRWGRFRLLRFAGLGSAAQCLLVLAHGMHALGRLESLEHGDAVQVVDFVLQAHAEHAALGLVAHKVRIKVVRLHHHAVGALDLAAHTGNGQASFREGHKVVGLLDDNGIDEDDRIVMVSRTRSPCR